MAGSGPAEDQEDASVSSILDTLGSWFSGVSDKLYTAVSDNLRNKIDLNRVTDRVSNLIPQFDYAPNSVINKNEVSAADSRNVGKG